MKPEFMRLRRAVASTLAALLIGAGIVVLSPALSASAHTHQVTADCDTGLTITLKSYPTTKKTTVEVVIDGATEVDTSFTGNWSRTITWDSTRSHDFTVTVISPDDPEFKNKWSFIEHGSVGACKVPDDPKISITGDTCARPGEKTGTITFSLSGVTGPYMVELLSGTVTTMQVSSSNGTKTFDKVPTGIYTLKASVTGGPSATSGSVTVVECAPVVPAVALDVNPCLVGGTAGTVTANLSKLTVGSNYVLKLYSSTAATPLATLPLTATAATFTHTFPSYGPGTFHVEVTDPAGALLTSSAKAKVLPCAVIPTITVELEPCVPNLMSTGGNRGTTGTSVAPMAPAPAEREISVTLDGLAPSTVYTLVLVTADPAAQVIATIDTPGDSATTFTHTFTNVPAPADYRVEALGAPASVVSNPITAPLCDLPTMAPPSIDLTAPVCDDATSPAVLTARLIDLDATKTYYVRIVDGTGATVPGGEDKAVTGSTSATVTFPAVPVPGSYAAQLLIDPGKQLAASSTGSTDLSVCLPTLAMTGPGVLIPLGSVAALLLTLGGAVVTGRLRRRMAL